MAVTVDKSYKVAEKVVWLTLGLMRLSSICEASVSRAAEVSCGLLILILIIF